MPACHTCMIYVVSAKTLPHSNGLIAKFIILSLVPSLPTISISYAKLPNIQNLVHLPCCPLIVTTCHQTGMVPLSPPTMLTNITAPQSTATHITTLAVICTDMTITMMISTATDHLVLALTAIMLPTILSILLENPTLTLLDVTLSVPQKNFLKLCHILMALIILPGTLIQMRTLTILLILTVMDTVKIPLQLLIQQLTWTMNLTKYQKLVESSQQPCNLHLMFTIILILKPKNTATGIIPNMTNSPQLG